MEILLLALLAALAIWVVYVWIHDTNRFAVVEYKIFSDKIKKPYSFALLSDLHNKSYGKKNEKLAGAIRRLDIDSVIVAGDMYTSKEGADYRNALELFRKIAGKCPIYYANGNHEQKTRLFPELYGHVYKSYMTELKKLGVKVLINERITLPEYNLELCGTEIGRECYRRFAAKRLPKEYMEKLLGKPNKEACEILIAHNPEYFKEYGDWGADIVLSGHIHGGVVKLPGLGGVISPSLRLFPEYDGGLFTTKGHTMVLSRGLGMHTLPVRVWNPGELVVVHVLPRV